MNFFRTLDLDRISFWFGFAAAGILWWFIKLVRPTVRQGWERARYNLKGLRERVSTGTEVRHREDTLHYAQGMHLAARFCPLDALLIPPRLLPPPVYTAPEAALLLEAIPNVIPYLPEWPEAGTAYNAPRLSLAEALSKGANVVLIGHAGYGKTTALADLASRIARQEEDLGGLQDLLPLLVHVADLDYENREKPPLDVLTDGLMEHASPLTQPRLGSVVRTHLDEGSAILLLDGLDELHPDELRAATDWLRSLMEAYPALRVAAAASLEDYDGLTAIGLHPMAMRTWGAAEREVFLKKWRAVWRSLPGPEEGGVPHQILLGWLHTDDWFDSPLEYTLRIWALFAGDALGSTAADAIEAHLRRTAGTGPEARRALARLAWEHLHSPARALDSETSNQILGNAAVSPEAEKPPEDELPAEEAEAEAGEEAVQKEQRLSLNALARNKLFVRRRKRGFALAHPIFRAYLAAEHLGEEGSSKEAWNLPKGAEQSRLLQFLASRLDLSARVDATLLDEDDPLFRDLLAAARWLPFAAPAAPWRGKIMRTLAQKIQHKHLPLGMRLRFTVALALSRDPGANVLLRRLMVESPTAEQRYLGALGSGLLQDPKNFPVLETLLQDNNLRVQQAACLAISTQKHPKAIEKVVEALVGGDESLRQVAAETLAAHPQEGHEVLREGSVFDDLLVRRAVVSGLMRIPEKWARDMLLQMQIEDGEWVVRSAAEQASKQIEEGSIYIPVPQPPLKDTPWLLAFAAEQGRGLSNEEQALSTLSSMLRNGTPEQQLQTLERIRLLPGVGEGTISGIYLLLYGDQPDLQEAALGALWHLAAAGVSLPSPRQFGFA